MKRVLIALAMAMALGVSIGTSSTAIPTPRADFAMDHLKADPALVAYYAAYEAIPREYRSFVMAMNQETEIPAQILARLITVESGWRPRAVSPPNQNGTQDYGLMQLNSAYLEYFQGEYFDGPEFDPLDPFHSLTVGMRYLRRLRDQTDSWHDAVAAYNCGIVRVRRREIPAATLVYIQKIMEGS